MEKINIEDFKKIELTVGEIISAEKVPDTDKLLKLSVNLGEEKPRQIVSGIAEYYPDANALVGKKCFFVSNLEPRIIRGIESQGMICALSDSNGLFSLIVPEKDVPPGTKAK